MLDLLYAVEPVLGGCPPCILRHDCRFQTGCFHEPRVGPSRDWSRELGLRHCPVPIQLVRVQRCEMPRQEFVRADLH